MLVNVSFIKEKHPTWNIFIVPPPKFFNLLSVKPCIFNGSQTISVCTTEQHSWNIRFSGYTTTTFKYQQPALKKQQRET